MRKELVLLVAVLLLALSADTFDKYFNVWAYNPETYVSFNARDWEIAKYLNTVSPDVEKYIVVRDKILDSRVITISSQSILFGTGTFLHEERARKNFHYVTPEELEREIARDPYQWAEIVFLGSEDEGIIRSLREKYRHMGTKLESGFIILTLSP